MTFSEEIKNEIIKKKIKRECCGVALLSAYLHTCGNVISRGGNVGFEFITENEHVAEYVCLLFASIFGINLTIGAPQYDYKLGKDKFSVEYFGTDAVSILLRLKLLSGSDGHLSLIFGIDDSVIKNECCRSAYVCGAFLGGGSCTLPDEQTYSRTGYHLEFVFSNNIAASDFADLLCDFEILVKIVGRKESTVVYAKSKEVISDVLNVIGVNKSLKKLNKIVELKDKINNDNRVNNCSVSNIDKTVIASVAQIKAIEVIAQTVGLQSLDANLFEVAEARLADKNASMQELACRLGITKSCINHRMRKIIAMASQLM